jgi:gluconate 2-dehydrogenase gamma chain
MVHDDDLPVLPRRRFIQSTAYLLSGAYLAANWTQVVAAAEHAHDASTQPGTKFRFFSASEQADVAAIASCIIPSDSTPGAREANAIHFIDAALTTFLARLAPEWRTGYSEFSATFRTAMPGVDSFSRAIGAQQIAFLGQVERTGFFNMMRTLTVLGTLTSPKYGGNREKIGWKLMGFEDLHVFEPPFGDYDREYAGFVPYPGVARS